jgi:hypothetical protein
MLKTTLALLFAATLYAQGDFPPCDPASPFLYYTRCCGYCVADFTDCGVNGRYCQDTWSLYDSYYGTTCDSGTEAWCEYVNGANVRPKNPLVPETSPEVIPALLLLHLPHRMRTYHLHPVRSVDLTELYRRRFWWRHNI